MTTDSRDFESLDAFQKWATNAWFGPRDKDDSRYLSIPALGAAGEAGEVADKVKKILRGDDVDDTYLRSVAVEISDTLFYLSVLADRLGFYMSDVAKMQIDKCNDRRARDAHRGEGDNR